MPESFSINRLSDVTGVDRRTIKKRLADVAANPDGTYDGRDAFKAIFEAASKQTEAIELSEARLSAANAEIAEVKAAKISERAFDVVAIEAAWSEIILAAKTKFSIVPTKAESRYVAGMSGTELRKMLEEEVDDVLNDLSKPPSYKEPQGAEETD